MDEEEFDALSRLRPFGAEDAKRADLQYRRSSSLSATLWGKTAEDLQRQLLAPYPEIAPGFGVADYQYLLRMTEPISAAMSRTKLDFETIVVGAERYTEWEARCEILRRAIDYLENH